MEQLTAESWDIGGPKGWDKLVQAKLLVWMITEPALNSLAKRQLEHVACCIRKSRPKAALESSSGPCFYAVSA